MGREEEATTRLSCSKLKYRVSNWVEFLRKGGEMIKMEDTDLEIISIKPGGSITQREKYRKSLRKTHFPQESVQHAFV